MVTRRGGLLAVLVGLLLLAGAVARAAPPPARPPSVVRGLQWIRRQQNLKTGLFTSYDMPGDTTAWTYDQALAIKALLAGGGQTDALAAVRCAEAMLSIRDPSHHAWSDAYSAVGLKRKVQVEVVRGDYVRWRWRAAGDVRARPRGVGPNAWMGLALLDLYGRTVAEPGLAGGGRPSPADYLAAAEQIADFIISLQLRMGVSLPDGSAPREPRTEGAIVGGYDEEGKLFTWVSTEHCVDSIAFFAALAKATGKPEYRAAAVLTARWFRREMWDEEAGCYFPGYESALDGTASTYRERLDGQTWSALALHAAAQDPDWPEGDDLRAENGLPWIDRFLCTGVEYKNGRFVGFPKVTGEPPAGPAGARHPVPPSPWPGVWTEGTAGAILAARRGGRAPGELSEMVRSLRDLQQGRGGVLYSVGESHTDVMRVFSAQDLPVATFEAHPDCLFGNVGIYGKGEPDWEAVKKAKPRGEARVPPFSWYYEPSTPGYEEGVGTHSGRQGFRIVNGGPGCLQKKDADGKPLDWSSLGIDLGPRVDAEGNATDDPEAAITPLDASAYWGFQFWARTEDARGARLAVGFRDARAKTAVPQV
ncbi:MAG: hypothetical protein IMZ65_00175, partial [Planctomycetes bacterium]|nr:hypothetical protein [Planctomycetota bacterium]